MNRLICIISLCLMTSAVSACGLFDRKEAKSTAPQPPFSETKTLQPPTLKNNPININPIEINNETTNKALDINNAPFVQLQDPNERFKRLEVSVQAIQEKLANVSPKIARLMDIESELGQLTFQLEQFLQKKQEPPPAPQPAMMAPVMAAPVMSVLETNTTSIPTTIRNTNLRNIRLGTHSNKMRIVLETDGKASYQTEFDDVLKTLIVVFPKYELGVDLKRSLKSIVGRSRAVNSITLHEDGQNIIAMFDIAKNVSHTKHFRAPPDKEYQYHRIVIDLFS